MTNAEHNRLIDQVHEAQRVVDLAEKEGVFNDCYGAHPPRLLSKKLRKHIRHQISMRMVELLAGQYPDLKWDIEDTTNTRWEVRGRAFDQNVPAERFHVVVRPRHWHEYHHADPKRQRGRNASQCARCAPEKP